MRPILSRTRRSIVVAALVAGTAALIWGLSDVRSADLKEPDKEAVERTRETVKMLDDVYKGYVVHITQTYVKAREDVPAATITKRVFKHVKDQGWHTGRLLDATGKPFSEDNLPKTEFEKEAVKQVKSGKAYYDEVATVDDKPVLRAATVVPAVMQSCVDCHSDSKVGEVLGALVYEVPIR